jgi:Domain of unknown function (DUF5063)
MVEQFVELVRKYVALIEALPGQTAREFLLECAVLLPQIYSLGCQLPEVDLPEGDSVEPEPHTIGSPMGKIMGLLGKYDMYSEVFDPVFDHEALTATLSDDLSDIYRDLKDSLEKYDGNEETGRREAIWEWKFNLQIHWGHHVVDALRPIHSLVFDHLDPEFQNEEDND